MERGFAAKAPASNAVSLSRDVLSTNLFLSGIRRNTMDVNVRIGAQCQSLSSEDSYISRDH